MGAIVGPAAEGGRPSLVRVPFDHFGVVRVTRPWGRVEPRAAVILDPVVCLNLAMFFRTLIAPSFVPWLRRASGLACALLTACGGGGGSNADPAPAAPTATPAYVVGTAAPLPSGATRVAQLVDVPWASLPAGTTVTVSPGTYGGPITITAQGTATQPIRVVAADPADPPVLTNSVDFQRAAWVQVSGLVVQQPVFGGFVIRQGSHHITVADSVVRQAPIGIDVTDGAGTGLALLRNRIEDSTTNGISVDGVNADPADRSLIQGNTVVGSGWHGIDLRGSHYRVEANTVTRSGQAIGGTSGIHVYSGGAGEGTGAGNLLRYNRSYANADTQLSDGNGIQIDQWCDGNTVAFNLVWGNDGAGIIVYDGNTNEVYANTARGNGLDPGGTHGTLGELILSGSAAGQTAGRPAGNRVYNNLLVATRNAVPALAVDSRAAAQTSNRVGPNLLFHAAGGAPLLAADTQVFSTGPAIDAISGTTGNLVTAPSFADVTQPLADGLRLLASPGGSGVALTGQTDITGRTATVTDAGGVFFGAYFFFAVP